MGPKDDDWVDCLTGETRPRAFPRTARMRERVYAPLGGASLTKRSHKDECDINKIAERCRVLGQVPAELARPGVFGDFTRAGDLADAMMNLQRANEDFMDLPARIRSLFDNDPVRLLEAAGDPEQEERLREAGLGPLMDAIHGPSEPETPQPSDGEDVQRPAPSAPPPSDDGGESTPDQ